MIAHKKTAPQWAAFWAEIAECLIGKRMTHKEIADHFHLNPHTASYHIGVVKRRISLQNRG